MVRKLISLILCFGVIIGLIFVITKVADKFNSDLKTIHPSYVIGGLDANGEYLECKDKLVFEEIIKYDSISIDVDFDSKISYEIFYYDYEDNFISSSGILNGKFEEESDYTKFIRLVIIPEFSSDEEPEIKFYQKLKYTTDLTIKVKENKNSTLQFAIFINNVPYSYNFEEGMTWNEFIDSDYNSTLGFYISSTGFLTYKSGDNSYSVTTEKGLNISGASSIIPRVYVSTN